MSNDDDIDVSPSGSPIYHHQERERDWQPPEDAGRNLDDISAHVERHIGPIKLVFHEIISDLVHLDIHWVPPGAGRRYHTLVTSGISDLPMKVPEGMEGFQRAELLIALPPQWPIRQDKFEDENVYWPIRWLKQIGRLPHEFQTWIGWGHSIPNGDPPEPIANTGFTGVVLVPPFWLDPKFFQLEASNGDTITFFLMMPVYPREMELKLKKGLEALEDRFEARDISFILDIEREDVTKKKGLFGLW